MVGATPAQKGAVVFLAFGITAAVNEWQQQFVDTWHLQQSSDFNVHLCILLK